MGSRQAAEGMVVILGRANPEPGIHTHDRGYGFRACAFGASRNDESLWRQLP
jgi:hypothetical protein